jgi:hypothetical protein
MSNREYNSVEEELKRIAKKIEHDIFTCKTYGIAMLILLCRKNTVEIDLDQSPTPIFSLLLPIVGVATNLENARQNNQYRARRNGPDDFTYNFIGQTLMSSGPFLGNQVDKLAAPVINPIVKGLRHPINTLTRCYSYCTNGDKKVLGSSLFCNEKYRDLFKRENCYEGNFYPNWDNPKLTMINMYNECGFDKIDIYLDCDIEQLPGFKKDWIFMLKKKISFCYEFGFIVYCMFLKCRRKQFTETQIKEQLVDVVADIICQVYSKCIDDYDSNKRQKRGGTISEVGPSSGFLKRPRDHTSITVFKEEVPCTKLEDFEHVQECIYSLLNIMAANLQNKVLQETFGKILDVLSECKNPYNNFFQNLLDNAYNDIKNDLKDKLFTTLEINSLYCQISKK